MRCLFALVMLLALCITAMAVDGPIPPWEEFKALYRQSIEQEMTEKTTKGEKEKQVYTIDAARYVLNITDNAVSGEASLSGRIVSGGPDPILLYGNEIAIAEIQEMVGGVLYCMPDNERLAFLPQPGEQTFRLSFRFMATVKKEEGKWVFNLPVPPATQNTLQLELPPETQLIELPGIPDGQGNYFFSAQSQLRIAYTEKSKTFVAPPPVIELDTITRIRIEKNRLLLSTAFQPMRPAPEQLILYMPDGTRLATSSLNDSQWNKTGDNRFTITFPEQDLQLFSADFILDSRVNTETLSFVLPVIENNTGIEDRFVVEEPEDGQVRVEAEGLITSIPVAKLGESLAAYVPKNLHYMKAPVGTPIQLAYKPFRTVSSPKPILASQELFVSFAENGAVMSVLRMNVPPEIGSRLRLNVIENTEIWSLTVNNVKQSVYTDEQNGWIIPLDGGGTSLVELALLRHGDKLGLHGVLEAVMPETGLPSRELLVGIALPDRVNLLSLEGAVAPASVEECDSPGVFLGNPHFFSKSFYKGEGMIFSIMYKEPVNQNL